MIDEKTVELIQREIDGLNSAEESAELKVFLEENPAAQTLYRELRMVSEKLHTVAPAEPPAHLKTVIMNSLPKHRYTSPAERGFWQTIKSNLALKPRFQLALAFSGGLAAGLILFVLFNANPDKLALPDPADLYGTLASRDFSEKIPVADQITLQLEHVQGTVALKASGELVFVEMDLHTQAGIEIFLAFQKPGIRFRGFTGLDEVQQASLMIEEQGLRFYPQTATRITFLFSTTTSRSTAININIIESGDIIYEKKLTLPGTLD